MPLYLRSLLTLVAVLSAAAIAAGTAQEDINGAGESQTTVVNQTRGLLWMVGSGRLEDSPEAFDARLADPNLAGMFLRFRWEEIEPREDEYDWEALDRLVALARKHDKIYKLMILPGIRTPDWVYAKGVEQFDTTMPWPLRGDFGQPVRMPLPWDETYLEQFADLLADVAERYGDDPHFTAITLTGVNFVYGEMHLPARPEDLEQWQQHGDYPAKVEVAYKRLLDLYARHLPRQQLVFHITLPLRGMADHLDRIVAYGIEHYPDQIALQNAQLTGLQDNSRVFSYRFILDRKDRVHTGFQSLHSFVSLPERVGSMEMAVYNVVRAEGAYWEIFWDDGLDPAFTAKLAAEWETARRLGPEAYKAHLQETGAWETSDAERRAELARLEEAEDWAGALAVLNPDLRYFAWEIDRKVRYLRRLGRHADAVAFLEEVVEKTGSGKYRRMLAELSDAADPTTAPATNPVP